MSREERAIVERFLAIALVIAAGAVTVLIVFLAVAVMLAIIS